MSVFTPLQPNSNSNMQKRFLQNYLKFTWFHWYINQLVCRTHDKNCRAHLSNLENSVSHLSDMKWETKEPH